MSVLLDGRSGTRRVAAGPAMAAGPEAPARQAPPRPLRPVRPGGRSRRALGETRRPPTRARVIAGHRAPSVAPCGPRRVSLHWPWLVGLALASAMAVTGLGLLAGAMSPTDVPSQTATVSVTPGETLSELAARFAPESDPGAVVARIKALNGLDDATLVPGLPLSVPVGPGGAAVPDAG
ncbi:MAG: hypothetical protein JWQ81_1464 [Amycolatopsis sp.]|jgi:hypothetical protein|uniref:LysM peptidoglycan-binding domain-containing protein n=1 Tax=Amycolatopsis sp. TaxID=37632 RepID=UPI002622BD1F|nr:LysM peptidoglycan-binding domain-containing protein [Amycolatopsis sp.]MCU1680725.1 hypothetical protein [Amycolatopsis sp.]